MTRRIGHYKVLHKLGEGAMGSVYKGLDEQLDMTVAIKVLSPGIVDRENLARFEREAQAAANLKHPNIAHVFFVGRTEDDLPFFAMEFVGGDSMAEVINSRMRVTGRQMLTLMRQSSSALQFAADKGVLHRDVKPANIMIEKEAGAKLVDFGVSKPAHADVNLTATGMALGTPKYLSPEQAEGGDIDFRCDMYSLGVTFFELVVGRPPFDADSPVAIIMKHVKEPIPNIRDLNDRIPWTLCRIIERMMSKEPEHRYSSYDEIIAGLDEVMANKPEFVDSEWTFCEVCGVNTIREDGRRCSRCGNTIGPEEKEEFYMSVNLVGFNDQTAGKKMVRYMMKTTRRSEAVIENMFHNLPVVLSPKLPMKKAKALQKKLYGLGAQVELKRNRAEMVKTGASRPVLLLDSGERHSQSMSVMRVPPPEEKSRMPMYVGLLISAFIIAVSVVVFSWWLSGNVEEKTEEIIEQAKTDEIVDDGPPPEQGLAVAEGKAAVDEAADNVPDEEKQEGVDPGAQPAKDETEPGAPTGNPAEENDMVLEEEGAGWGMDAEDQGFGDTEYITSSGNCRFRAASLEDENLLVMLGRYCEDDLSRIRNAMGSYNIDPLNFRVDGRRDFALMKSTFGLGTTSGRNEIFLHGKIRKRDKSGVRAVLAALIARQLLRQEGGPSLPRWMEAGFALDQMDRLFPGVYDPGKDIASLSKHLDETLWNEAFEQNSPEAYAQAALFVRRLDKKYHSSSLVRVARLMKRGAPAKEAFHSVYRQGVESLLKRWFEETQE